MATIQTGNHMLPLSPTTPAAEAPTQGTARIELRRVDVVKGNAPLRANSVTRRLGLAIWLLAAACLVLGALVWWQLLRALP
ncbi:MAG: hypothetical protein AB7I37_07975 [Pirellulales bacterium]